MGRRKYLLNYLVIIQVTLIYTIYLLVCKDCLQDHLNIDKPIECNFDKKKVSDFKKIKKNEEMITRL